jgi:hypothetical protein
VIAGLQPAVARIQPLPMAMAMQMRMSQPCRSTCSLLAGVPQICQFPRPPWPANHTFLRTTLSMATAAQQMPVASPADDALGCVCFTVIIDDIVFPDGKTLMGALGGGGAQLHVWQLCTFRRLSTVFSPGSTCKASADPQLFHMQDHSRCLATSCITSSASKLGLLQASALTFRHPARFVQGLCNMLASDEPATAGQSMPPRTWAHASDRSSASQEWLEALNVATSGLLLTDGVRTPRAWQILEDDGRRTQVCLHAGFAQCLVACVAG